jgi:hypothetical protein
MELAVELSEYISGERFQKIADVSFIPIGNGLGEKDCSFVVDQQRNNNYNVFYYSSDTKTLPEEVLSAKIIFVNTWTLDKFFKIIFPLLTNQHIFISHNSDMGISSNHINYLNDNKVVKWYSQNASVNHPKLFALPIGLGNQQYPHGNVELLNDVITGKVFDNLKFSLAFKNFSIQTNQSVRSKVDEITHRNGFYMTNNFTQRGYFEILSKSFFSISPPGNGIDCHRIWESLYVGTIPIVQNHECFSQFKHLPILFIDKWEEVTHDLLYAKSYITSMFKKPIPELKMSYWVKKITKT